MALRSRDIVCRQAVDLMVEYLDGALPRRQRRRLERHLRACPNCSAYLQQIRMTVAAVGAIEPGDLDEEAIDDLVNLYRQWRGDTSGDR